MSVLITSHLNFCEVLQKYKNSAAKGKARLKILRPAKNSAPYSEDVCNARCIYLIIVFQYV